MFIFSSARIRDPDPDPFPDPDWAKMLDPDPYPDSSQSGYTTLFKIIFRQEKGQFRHRNFLKVGSGPDPELIEKSDPDP
jgi:hypothetical protein